MPDMSAMGLDPAAMAGMGEDDDEGDDDDDDDMPALEDDKPKAPAAKS
jgi:hypothetical protein